MSSSRRLLVAAIVAIALLAPSLAANAEAPANLPFQNTWERTDKPVADGQVSRTWMWGPEAFTGSITEPYVESPGGSRTVQYFDKARMEITTPSADPTSIWYVTNGLLVNELITGQMQVGNEDFEPRSSAAVNVAGDSDDTTGPTYATFASLLDAPPLAPVALITQRVNREAVVTNDPDLASRGVTTAIVDDVTNHAIAGPFWAFMNSSGTVYENGSYTAADLFENAYFATGRPITEAYWANVKVAGTYQDVLLQCFERRCLTFNPQNSPEWQVEAGNVGQHYYAWRYGGTPPTPPPLPPVPPQTEEPPMSELEYLNDLIIITDDLIESVDWVVFLVETIDLSDPTWVALFLDEMDVWRTFEPRINELRPPAIYAAGHAKLVEGYGLLTDAANLYTLGINTLDVPTVEQAAVAFEQALTAITEGLELITGEDSPDVPETPPPAPDPDPQPNCHSAYPSVCIPPPPPDLNCDDIPFTDFIVLPSDPHGFDHDSDGSGCESS